ncbi:MAG: electron transfer flavoprotein subunit alpha/FixB family protein [Pirellulaceae bacterium]
MPPTIVSCHLPGFAFDCATQGLLGESRRVARRVEGRHVAVVPMECDGERLAELSWHCDTVLAAVSDPRTGYDPQQCLVALQALCSEIQPAAVFLGDDTYSQELTPRLAHRLGGCGAGDVQATDWRDGRIHVTRSVYGGKATAIVRMNRSPAVVWLRARSLAAEPPRETAGGIERRDVTPLLDAAKKVSDPRIVERHEEPSRGVRLEDADVIVSGGRGLGGPEPFEDLKRLAAAMGAEVAVSRAASDAGWAPPSWQIGQTGKKVAPQLYLAIAISGASQHMMGVADAKVIAAVNSDAEAPIFRHCKFGLVEDYRKVVGPLCQKLTEMLS